MEGRFNGGLFALPVWGGLYFEELIYGGAYFRNFTVFCDTFDCNHLTLVNNSYVTVEVFALLDFQFKGNFQVQAPGAYIREAI